MTSYSSSQTILSSSKPSSRSEKAECQGLRELSARFQNRPFRRCQRRKSKELRGANKESPRLASWWTRDVNSGLLKATMPKQRFSKLDIRRAALELNSQLSGFWVNNIYDAEDESKTFLIKLTQPKKEKQLLVIESGVRFHLSKFVKDTPSAPSGFSMKLRKHVRGKRLLSIKQFGDDRVVDFTFGLYEKRESEYHVILELYAAGNVVLTDCDYNVLSLIRVFRDDEVRFAVGENYLASIGKVQTEGEIQQEGNEEEKAHLNVDVDSLEAFLQSVLDEQATRAAEVPKDSVKVKKQKGGGGPPSLKQTLSLRSSVANVLGPDLIEHCILLADLTPSAKLSAELVQDKTKLEQLAASLNKNSKEVLQRLDDVTSNAGVLVYEKKRADDMDDETQKFYDRFDPVLLEQYKCRDYTTFESHSEAVDEFFSKIDMQRNERQALAQKKQAEKKVQSIKADQEARLKQLRQEELDKKAAAEALTANIPLVDNALLIVRSSVASGMNWVELDELIAAEKVNGNPIASIIESTKLETNEITLRLPDLEDERKSVLATVDINMSAYANVSRLYSSKKQAASKTERTVDASTKVLEEAQKKFERDLAKQELNRTKVRVARKVNWFEKFRWFISSEGFLILSGRDAQQNELLVKKYLRKSHGDVYVHADLHGASSCIVRSPRPGVTIPPETLRQAGAMTVSMSSAWTAKIVTSAWWVSADQVSKTAPTGEYLSTGSFMIRGKKNFLPPSRLELVFGFIFKLDETQVSYDNRPIEWKAQAAVGGNEDFAFPQGPKPTKVNSPSCALDSGENETHPSESPSEDLPSPDTAQLSDTNGRAPEAGSEATSTIIKEESSDEEDALMKEDPPPCVSSQQNSKDVADNMADLQLQSDSENDKEHNDEKGNFDANLEKELDKSDMSKQSKQKQSKQKQDVSFPPGANGGRRKDEPAKKKGSNLPRGKRGKLNKIKKKYANQTEEERRLALLALGHKLPEKANEEEELAAESNDRQEQGHGSEKKSKHAAPRPPRPPKAFQDEETVDDELNLRSFTCNPQPDDVILYALPVCAPPSAATNYKFRIKLTPGTQKKGKAGRQVVEICTRLPVCTEREKELLRIIPEREITFVIQGNVTISAPGVNKNKNLSKAAKAAKQAKRIKKPRK